MTQELSKQYDTLEEHGILPNDVPSYIMDNLSSKIKLRPYQISALRRFLYYYEKNKDKSLHLLFHMATGSGKTVLMAALILELYQQGYRNFLFFVNSSQIIKKTKDNFLNISSPKYLFSSSIRMENKLVDIREVDTFDAGNNDSININFTTTPGLHSRIQNPRENSITIEDFEKYKIAMISDEAHHLNVETKNGTSENEQNWENTVQDIFKQNLKNVLLEFTATVDLNHEAIAKKYSDKILYDYSLRQFREDGYSKDIELRQADLPPAQRMLQAVVLSQYRRKIAEFYGLHLKPVVLMKSNTIPESKKNESIFKELIEKLNGDKLQALKDDSKWNDDTLSRAFSFIFDTRKMTTEDFVHELQSDFSSEKIVNVNECKDLEKKQIELNTLENSTNEIRVIFAVKKLDEGWDVLNLFDIVRLHETRGGGKSNKISPTTMAEAQLIGRGARYYPFESLDYPEIPLEKRKYDKDTEHDLRILEELHYHCAHNPKYIHEITLALRETGMLDEKTRDVQLKLKDSFKKTDFYLSEHVWMNEQKRNTYQNVNELNEYHFKYPAFMTGYVTEQSPFDIDKPLKLKSSKEEPISKDYQLSDFGKIILRSALDAIEFFHFTSLKKYFPKIEGINDFMSLKEYLGGVTVAVQGLPSDLQNLSPRQKLEIANYVLQQIKNDVKLNNSEFIGTKDFKPYRIKDRFTDKTIKLSIQGEKGLSWEDSALPGFNLINLKDKEWYAYNTNYGTDQEKHFIKYIHDQSNVLNKKYDEFYLLRNEKAVKIYNFEDGQAFEPDFLLFLKEKKGKQNTIMQLFIEPKGDLFATHDAWKEEFLKKMKSNANMQVVFKGKDYEVYGLPFFNEEGKANKDFKEAFKEFL